MFAAKTLINGGISVTLMSVFFLVYHLMFVSAALSISVRSATERFLLRTKTCLRE